MDRWEALRTELNAPEPWWRRRGRAVIAGAALLAAIALIGATALPRSPGEPQASSPPATTTTSTTASTTTAAPAIERVWPQATPRVVDGWEIGQEGDLVAVGDWGCTGDRTPAVARPATGEVWVFDAWAESSGRPAGSITPGATVIRSAGCGRLQARHADGRVDELAVEP